MNMPFNNNHPIACTHTTQGNEQTFETCTQLKFLQVVPNLKYSEWHRESDSVDSVSEVCHCPACAQPPAVTSTAQVTALSGQCQREVMHGRHAGPMMPAVKVELERRPLRRRFGERGRS